MKIIPFLPNEQWAKLILNNYTGLRQYAISNHGRVVSYTNAIENGRLLLKNTKQGEVPTLKIVYNNNKYRFAVHKLVAQYFLPAPKDDCIYVLHLDKKNSNNYYKNLVYANYYTYRKRLAGKDINKVEKIRLFANEEWKKINSGLTGRNHAITNYGRLISYQKAPEDDGVILNGSLHKDGYKIWRYKLDGKSKHMLFHRIVAEYFLDKPTAEQVFVIHLDHKKTNNAVANLKWATTQELQAHSSLSEAVKKHHEDFKNRSKINGRGSKLTVGKVLLLKKILSNTENTTRKKMIAKQFGISTMQLLRIKKGENWGWAKADEPDI